MSHPADRRTHDEIDRLYERVLVLRCQTGDEAAFEELVARYAPRLAAFLRRMLDRDADDALQDVWLDVFRGVAKLQDLGAFPAWIFRVARDRAYRMLRRRGIGPATTPLDGIDLPGPDSPDDAVACADDAQLVRASLDRLPHAQREVLLLRFIEAMSYEQIAVVTGSDLGTVRSRLHYAKRALREVLGKERP